MSPLPEIIAEFGQQKLADFNQRAGDAFQDWLQQFCDQNQRFTEELLLIWGCSDYAATLCMRKPQLFKELVESGDLEKRYDEFDLQNRLGLADQAPSDEAQLMARLRYFRNREMLRIIWRDLTRKASLEQTTQDLTWLAEACLQQSSQWLHQQLTLSWGQPQSHEGENQQLLVLGMGKLGGAELNLSSDIDLIFIYPESGNTQGGKRQCSNQEFFERLGRSLIKVLDETTVDGFVFRVDMRLRPYGKSGPLAMSFAAFDEYCQTQGRDWERFAMLKARVVVGPQHSAEQLAEILRQFSFRRYIDFSVIQSLRDMKALMERERLRDGHNRDVKKSAGGIREVEFIVQSFQLIRGGRDLELQISPLKQALSLLSGSQLPEEIADLLYSAYVFLRNVEHALQSWKDQQTQQLPDDETSQQRLAFVMGFENWPDFMAQLNQHRTLVSEVFSDMLAESSESSTQSSASDQIVLSTSEDGLKDQLAQMGFEDVSQAYKTLKGFLDSRAVAVMSEEARRRFDRLLPLLLPACGETDNPPDALTRSFELIGQVLGRSTYLVLLEENPAALNMLVKLCSASPWIAKQLARYPVLLDELLDHRSLYQLQSKAELTDELRQQLLRVPEEDLEQQMDVLRYFKMACSLKVAVCEVMDILPLMKVSDCLTELAEVLLDQVLEMAWSQMTAKFGHPGAKAGEAMPSLAVIGYGKLGGIELGHGSDLDLVFVHNSNSSLTTDGTKSIDNATFFARLGQRIIHLLNAQTTAGHVYEVDMRLRPSGNSGLLVTSIESFAKYQQESAWVWEHQALVRARPVAGCEVIAQQFQQLRQQILTKQRDSDSLREEVANMRQKMLDNLSSSEGFDLKKHRGGIIDIEFIVQFCVLNYAHKQPDLTRYTDNVRLLEVLAKADVIGKDDVTQLSEAYIYFRSQIHRLFLQGKPSITTLSDALAHREVIAGVWQRIFKQ